ncbi:phosphate acetyltransferase [Porphyromonadaceae bacterium W3.11]|nr:phosphate acetyltransferase [Porphyromonadaceae bacterium W3.11]
MQLLENLVAKAKQNKRRIVLPEGLEERTLRAADRLLEDEVAHIILIGKPDEVKAKASELGLKNIDKAEIVCPINNPKKETHANILFELRKAKGMTIEEATKLAENPLYLACLMIKNGDADGEVAGAFNTTGNVLRPALQIIKTAPGIRVVSGAFIMIVNDQKYGDDGVLVFGDCAVMPDPKADELAQIAVSSASTARTLVGMEPRIAMLSFSTKGSAKHDNVDKVAEATKLAQEMAPELSIDGELQVDAALDLATGQKKAPGSKVAGKANVMIFPDLQAGNIGYKLVQRLGGATAIGPILQGIAMPVNDLSRGCSVEDIYYMVAITSNQATAALAKK